MTRRASRTTLSQALFATAIGLGVACGGCGRHAGARSDGRPEPPAGEVWLTDAQVTEARIKVEEVEEQSVANEIVTGGRVAFNDTRVTHVFSPVSGRLTRIDARLGERVKKGDVLAVLQSPDIGLTSSDLDKAEADRIAAEHELARQAELLEAHATSRRDFEQAEDTSRKAKAEVQRAKQKALLFHAGVAGSVTQTYALRSPIAGEVVARNVAPGTEVQGQYGGGTAVDLFTVGELDRLWVLADVYEIDTARVRVGSRVDIKLFAMPNRVLPASIEWISDTLDPSTRTTKVRCALDNSERLLKPEMYATLDIVVDERTALAMPRGALLRLGEQTWVFVEKGRSPDGRRVFARAAVVVDQAARGRWLPVLKGLERGALIATEGNILLAGEK